MGGPGQGLEWEVPHQPMPYSHNYPYSFAISSFLLMLLYVGLTA